MIRYMLYYYMTYILPTTLIFIKILFSSWFDWQSSFLQISICWMDRCVWYSSSWLERWRHPQSQRGRVRRASYPVACAADETKLWLSPSVIQRPNPCSSHPPVYWDLSALHNWPVQNSIVNFPIKVKEIRNTLQVIRWCRWGPEQGYRCCFADVTNRGWIPSAGQASYPAVNYFSVKAQQWQNVLYKSTTVYLYLRTVGVSLSVRIHGMVSFPSRLDN